jgi:hypothetical protein
MSTRASIKFSDSYDEFFLYRHSDGFPENVLSDIEETVTECENRWSGTELGQLVSYFLGKQFNPEYRIQSYEPTSGIHGDESHCYFVAWNDKLKKYEFGEN